jgi:hypothetical protein
MPRTLVYNLVDPLIRAESQRGFKLTLELACAPVYVRLMRIVLGTLYPLDQHESDILPDDSQLSVLQWDFPIILDSFKRSDGLAILFNLHKQRSGLDPLAFDACFAAYMGHIITSDSWQNQDVCDGHTDYLLEHMSQLCAFYFSLKDKHDLGFLFHCALVNLARARPNAGAWEGAIRQLEIQD